MAAGAAKDIGDLTDGANRCLEATDGPVFEWYIKDYGNEVNLFVDHSQILQLEGLRQSIWGNESTGGRMIKPSPMSAPLKGSTP